MIIGTAGHIDHGKTALVKALTGVDTDRLPEEKRRGITVELGFAPIELDGFGSASIIDVPGHEAFVKTMIAGASGIDVGLLVIAADEGIMPQTREHLTILSMLAIPKLVVALTKSDLADADWLNLVREEVAATLAMSKWPSAPIVPCSAVSGKGLPELRAALASAASAITVRRANDLFRLPVDRSFTLRGTGTVVTGSVWSGELAHDSAVRVLPGGKTARVRRLHRHGIEVPRVSSGERAAIALGGLDVSDVPRGSVLVTEPSWEPTAVLDAWITLFGDAELSVRARTTVRFQLGGADVGASMATVQSALEGTFDGFARIRLDTPITARGGDRFVLRLPAPVGTIGGGVVLDPNPDISFSSAAKRFLPEAAQDVALRLGAFLDGAGTSGLDIAGLPVRLGCAPAEVETLLSVRDARISGGHAFNRAQGEEAKAGILSALREAETTFPLAPGVKMESLRASLGWSPELLDLAIADLESGGAIAVSGSLVTRSGWAPAPSAADAKKIDSLAHAICAGGNEPPSVSELEKQFGGEVAGMLRYLERESRVVQIDADRFYAPGAVDGLVAKLRNGLQHDVEYGPSQLRELLGFSRKYLIPFLEYCDRAGITERKAAGRSLKSVRSSLTHT